MRCQDIPLEAFRRGVAVMIEGSYWGRESFSGWGPAGYPRARSCGHRGFPEASGDGRGEPFEMVDWQSHGAVESALVWERLSGPPRSRQPPPRRQHQQEGEGRPALDEQLGGGRRSFPESSRRRSPKRGDQGERRRRSRKREREGHRQEARSRRQEEKEGKQRKRSKPRTFTRRRSG